MLCGFVPSGPARPSQYALGSRRARGGDVAVGAEPLSLSFLEGWRWGAWLSEDFLCGSWRRVWAEKRVEPHRIYGYIACGSCCVCVCAYRLDCCVACMRRSSPLALARLSERTPWSSTTTIGLTYRSRDGNSSRERSRRIALAQFRGGGCWRWRLLVSRRRAHDECALLPQ